MKRYLMMRYSVVKGPFTLEELKDSGIFSSDLFAVNEEPLKWMPAEEVPELRDLVFIPIALHSRVLLLPGASGSKPAKWQFKKWFTDTEFRTYFIQFLNTLQTARIAALFVMLFTSTLFVKFILDSFIENHFEYMRASIIHPPATKSLEAGKNFRNAIVKTYKLPGDTNTKVYPVAGKPSEVMKLVEVDGRSFPARNPQPTSLLITVRNHSHYLVDNAEVEVEYVTKGKPIIETFQFKLLSPMGSKTMSVPLKKQHTCIKYKVLNIYTSQYTSLEKEV